MNDADASSSIQERPSVTGSAYSQVPHEQRSSSLDDYEIVREIGRGGTAIVYEAYHKSLRRRVALKQLPAAAALDPRWQERFQNEVRATSQLSHSGIVPFYELGNGGDSHFYTMQLIDGISLAEVIRRLRQCREGNRPCQNLEAECVHPAFFRLCSRCKCRFACHDVTTESDSNGNTTELTASPDYHRAVVELMRDAALAVQYAHDHGILHLDIKPSNILIDGEGKLWITDFGAARSSDGAGSERRSGTPCYMSPEQLEHDDQLDVRSDVYSLGATLYELLTLERPFGDDSRHALVAQVSTGNVKDPTKVNSAIPRELGAIINKAMARDTDERYATVSELADDLQDAIRSLGERVVTSVAGSYRSPRRLWLLLAAIIACSVIASFVLLGRNAEPKIGVVQEGLVGYWAAEGDARDSSGQGHHGALENGVGFAPGVRGQAFSFDGVNDWIATDHSFPNDQSHSISVWVKWQGRRSNGWQEVVSWWNSDDAIPNRIFLGTTGPTKEHARIRFGDDWINVPGRLPLGEWVHIAATYDSGTNERNVYLNGDLSGSKIDTQDAHFSTVMAIGRQGDYDGEYWCGLIDELAVYERVLSPAEISFNAPCSRAVTVKFPAWRNWHR